MTRRSSPSPQVDAGLDSELVLGDPKAPRFVYWNSELLPTPSGPDIATFKLLSIWGKIRAGLGAAGLKKPLPGELPALENAHCSWSGTQPSHLVTTASREQSCGQEEQMKQRGAQRSVRRPLYLRGA